MNEVFRGAFGAKLGSDDVKNYAGDDSEVRFKPKPCFRSVLKFFLSVFFFCIFLATYQNRNSHMCMGYALCTTHISYGIIETVPLSGPEQGALKAL